MNGCRWTRRTADRSPVKRVETAAIMFAPGAGGCSETSGMMASRAGIRAIAAIAVRHGMRGSSHASAGYPVFRRGRHRPLAQVAVFQCSRGTRRAIPGFELPLIAQRSASLIGTLVSLVRYHQTSSLRFGQNQVLIQQRFYGRSAYGEGDWTQRTIEPSPSARALHRSFDSFPVANVEYGRRRGCGRCRRAIPHLDKDF